MSEFRHVTNLETPYDKLDQALLDALGFDDYRIGPPVPAKFEGGIVTKSFEQLVESGIVGLYVTFEGLKQPEVARKTGWGTPALDQWNQLPVYEDPKKEG